MEELDNKGKENLSSFLVDISIIIFIIIYFIRR